MICVRCGYCCIMYMVVIVKPECVDKPDFKSQDTFIVKEDPNECPHLSFDEDGRASCTIHDKSWYKKTPCFSHGQIEASPDCECRLGAHILERGDNIREMARKYRESLKKGGD